MPSKIKKFVKDNRREIEDAIAMTVISLAGLAAYSYVCAKAGYRMVKPICITETHIVAKSISGKMLQVELIPIVK